MRRSALDWIEEAAHLLYQTSAASLALYYIGALPFVLAVIWYWLDMSHDAFANQRLETSSFLLAVVFLWMKCWQAVFAQSLLRELNGSAAPAWTLARIFRLAIQQCALQPSAFLLLPASSLALLPFARVLGFYQNVTLLGSGEELSLRELIRRARSLTGHWTSEAWSMLAIQLGFKLFVLLNLGLLLYMLPQLAKMFLGIESVFTLSNTAMLNSTFFLACLLITYILVDPLLKACYALRCFYGESLTTGADLRAELRHAD